MADGPKLVSLPVSNLRDIPACLGSIANSIEAGNYGNVKMIAAVLVREDFSMAQFGWGDCTALEIAGALARGVIEL